MLHVSGRASTAPGA